MSVYEDAIEGEATRGLRMIFKKAGVDQLRTIKPGMRLALVIGNRLIDVFTVQSDWSKASGDISSSLQHYTTEDLAVLKVTLEKEM